MVDRYVSEDGLHFEKRQRVIDRDAKDPPDQQFYYLSVTHTPKGRIGMLGHYRCQAQTMDHRVVLLGRRAALEPAESKGLDSPRRQDPAGQLRHLRAAATGASAAGAITCSTRR